MLVEGPRTPDAQGAAHPLQGGPMEVMEIPANQVGKLIGRGGETIRNLQLSSDTRIQVGAPANVHLCRKPGEGAALERCWERAGKVGALGALEGSLAALPGRGGRGCS